MIVKDSQGNELNIGDRVAWAVLTGYSSKKASLRVGKITRIVFQEGSEPRIRVALDNRRSRTPHNLSRVVKIG